MAIESVAGLTLRQKLSHADQMARELLEALEHGLIPKIHVLRRTAQQGLDSLEQGDVTDMTMRSTIGSVLQSSEFARQNADQLNKLLNAIEADILHVVSRQK